MSRTVSFAVYFLPLGSAFAFICASSSLSFAIAALSAAISARAAVRSRPAADDLVLCFAGQPSKRLLKKFDIGLQASGTTLHLLFGGAGLHSANVLCGCRRQQRRDEQRPRTAQKLRCCGTVIRGAVFQQTVRHGRITSLLCMPAHDLVRHAQHGFDGLSRARFRRSTIYVGKRVKRDHLFDRRSGRP